QEPCMKVCTATQSSITSKITVTKQTGVVMCPCEETLFESDFVDIIDVDNLSSPDFNIDGTTVKIKSEDGTYKKPSELNPDSHFDRMALHKYAASLARELNDMNNFFYIASRNGTDLSSENPASTVYPVKFRDGTKGSIITLNSNGGYSKDLDNVNNFKSILKHEIFHVDDNNKIDFKRNLSTHVDVYIKTANHVTYKSTTIDFQKGNAGSFVNYLLNMDRVADKYTQNEILAKIDEYNKNNGRVKIERPQFMFAKGTLSLRVIVDGVYTDYIPYKFIDEPQ
ncbi:hypothetical protein B6A10_16220, partial [Flavobacterium sp. L1I52]